MMTERDFDLSDDTFGRTGRIHDWRNHVPLSVIDIWETLTLRERFVAALVAQNMAEREEWE